MQPINLFNKQVPIANKGANTPTSVVLVNWFPKDARNLKFKYDLIDLMWIDFETIISM